MAQFNKKDLSIRFFVDGKECIESARILFDDKIRGPRSQYGILLIHGIELLLKSYLLIKNTTLTDDPKTIDIYLRKFGHKYKCIYDECKKYGDELCTLNTSHVQISPLEECLNFLNDSYFEDSVSVRYIQQSAIVGMNENIFDIIDKHLITPIKKLFSKKV